MLGLFLDNIIVFLFRLFRRWFLESRCKNWILSDAVIYVTRTDYRSYPYVEIEYDYKVGDASYSGICLHGFWDSDSARRFGEEFPENKTIRIRYSPDSSAKSYMREEDQAAFTSESQHS
jgi:hypothetical protein